MVASAAMVAHPHIIWLRHMPLTESNVGSYVVAQTNYGCTPYLSGLTIGNARNRNLFMQPYCISPSHLNI
jgi:hypothetical protein